MLGIKQFLCNLCAKRFRYNYELKQHLLAHKDPSLITCSICNKSFSTKARLKAHFKTLSHAKKTNENNEQNIDSSMDTEATLSAEEGEIKIKSKNIEYNATTSVEVPIQDNVRQRIEILEVLQWGPNAICDVDIETSAIEMIFDDSALARSESAELDNGFCGFEEGEEDIDSIDKLANEWHTKIKEKTKQLHIKNKFWRMEAALEQNRPIEEINWGDRKLVREKLEAPIFKAAMARALNDIHCAMLRPRSVFKRQFHNYIILLDQFCMDVVTVNLAIIVNMLTDESYLLHFSVCFTENEPNNFISEAFYIATAFNFNVWRINLDLAHRNMRDVESFGKNFHCSIPGKSVPVVADLKHIRRSKITHNVKAFLPIDCQYTTAADIETISKRCKTFKKCCGFGRRDQVAFIVRTNKHNLNDLQDLFRNTIFNQFNFQNVAQTPIESCKPLFEKKTSTKLKVSC